MRIHLVGADFEENLGLCMVAAAAEAARHRVEVLAFNDGCQLEPLARRILDDGPDLVGLSIQFQHRAHEFLLLARRLRAGGYRGHITCGGQFPTMAWSEVIRGGWGVDSVVLHEGERTVVELLEALAGGRALSGVAGLALPGGRTAPRRLEDELDRLPLARRYRPHTLHMGVPFIPIMGSRGCWGRCSYCSITTLYRDARVHGGARLLRHRSPQGIAEEMALLGHAAGGQAVFCFHDDNFLLPRPADSLARVRAIREALDGYGVGTIGIIGKCRPDSLTPELARELRALGVVRLYVGVENVSQAGSDHLQRRVRVEQVDRALRACQEAGIFGCYNLLLFEPDATLEDVERNVAFIRAHASQPVNFCRAEPYHGTPLQRDLARRGRLTGSYLGYDYRLEDDRAELLFRVCAAAFRERNFAPSGVHNRYMGLGYYVTLLERFYDDPARVTALAREAEALTRSIALETADFLDEAIAIAKRGAGDRDRIERETGHLGMRIAEADRLQHARLDEVYALLHGFADTAPRIDRPAPRPSPRLVQLARRMAQGVSVGVWLAACAMGGQGCDDRNVVDPVPNDGGIDMPVNDLGPDLIIVDPPPPDARPDNIIVDPPPIDMGPDVIISDPVPMDMGPGSDTIIVDPAPPDGTVVDMVPFDAGACLEQGEATDVLASHWRSTTPERVLRSQDLPLFDPPAPRIAGQRVDEGVRVTLSGCPAGAGLRWQCDGRVEGEGAEVLWRPGSDVDQISVGIRTAGGIAVVSLRLKDLA